MATPAIYLRSDKDTHFTLGIAQDEYEPESISFPRSFGDTVELEIVAISIQSDQNLEWEIFIWKDSNFHNSTNIDSDNFLEFVNFPSTVGKQIKPISGSVGQYYYSATNLSIRYRDIDASQKLHIGLCNRSAVAKLEGATGEVVVEVTCVEIL
jgi:hypothetical protein